MKNIITIFKKELKRIFTDRRILFSILLPGILIYFIYSLMGEFMMNTINKNEFTIYADNVPAELDQIFVSDENTIYHYNENKSLTKEEKIKSIEDGSIHLYIVYPDNFINDILTYDITSGLEAPQVEVYYTISNETSVSAYSMYTSLMNVFEETISNKFDIKEHVSGSESELMQSVMSGLLPMLIIIFLFTGALALCTDTIAGEKERGTIATLLITPAKRSHIALGKVMAISVAALLSATVSFFGITLSMPKLMGLNIKGTTYSFSTYIFIFIIIITTVLLFVTILSIVSTYAKTTKEATSLSSVIMISSMVISILCMVVESKNAALCIIPIFNTAIVLMDLLSGSINILNILIATIANIGYVGLGIFILNKMFNSEKIIFNS